MTAGILALYQAQPAVLRAFQARAYPSLALEAHREAVARAARFAAVGPITPTSRPVALSPDNCWPLVLAEPAARPVAPPKPKPSPRSPAALAIIKREVSREWAPVTPADIDGPWRHLSIVVLRHVAMWLARRVTKRSLPDIGLRFGGRDHTTVIHAVRATDARMAADPEFAARVERVRARVEGELAMRESG